MAKKGATFLNIISAFNSSGIKDAQTGFESLGSKVGKFAKVAAAAMAAAAAAVVAYAGKLLVDGVKAAIADEKAQAKLAQTLQNVTKATKTQISAVEDHIKKLSLATGVADDKLRPAYENLVRATGDISKAQNSLSLAMDISAGTGRSLESVSVALGKAFTGNISALTRLGIPLDANAVKSKNLDAIMKQLGETFGGQAAKQAETFEGKMARLSVAFDEAKETVGAYVLDAITPLLTWVVDKVVPALDEFAQWLGPKLKAAAKLLGDYWNNYLYPALKNVWTFIKNYVVPIFVDLYNSLKEKLAVAWKNMTDFVRDNKEALTSIAKFIGVTLLVVLKAVAWVIERLVDGFVAFTGALKNGSDWIKRNKKEVDAWLGTMRRVLEIFALINPAVGIALKSFDYLAEQAAKIDLSFAGEQASSSWLKGWGVGWESAPEGFDFGFDFGDSFAKGTGEGISNAKPEVDKRIEKFQEGLKNKLKEIKETFNSFKEEVQSIIVGALDFGTALETLKQQREEAAASGEEFGGTFLEAIQEQAEKAKLFAQRVGELIKLGLSKDALKLVLDAGVDAGTDIANELITGGSETISKTNELVESTKEAAKKVAKFAADSYYGTGLETAKRMVKGFKDLIKEGGAGYKELMDAMDKLAKKLEREIKLKISAETTKTTASATTASAIAGATSAPAQVINITVNGAIDAEGTARQIQNILRRSELRAGAY